MEDEVAGEISHFYGVTSMLSSRFMNDGKPSIAMSGLQRQARSRFETKVTQGEYRFVDRPCLCGADTREARLLAAKDRYGIPVQAWLCKKCTLIYLNPYFDEPSVAK